MALVPLTSRADIEAQLSAVGTALRVDHAPAAALQAAIQRATADIALRIGSRYPDMTALAANDFVRSIATNRAVIYLSMWRNNPVPKGLTDQWEDDKATLDDIRKGEYDLPGVSVGGARAPQLVHVTVNYGYNRSIRVTYQGTTNHPKGYVRRIDYTEPLTGT